MSALCRTEGLTHRFGGLVAIDGVDLRVAEGDIHGLIGPNGAGKSTLLNLLTGIYRPTSGTISFDGHSLLGRLPHEVARLGVARTFQDVQLFGNQTVLENVMTGLHGHLDAGLLACALRLPAQATEERRALGEARRILELMGLTSWANHRAASLSFGWQRRVSLARALAARPRMLLLDEPTAGMNPTTANEMGKLIGQVRDSGVTILLIEHNIPLVMKWCDRVTVLDQGRKIAESSAAEVRKNPDVIKAYLGERGQLAAAQER